MGTFAASIHLEWAGIALEALVGAVEALDLGEFTACERDGWWSLHRDDMVFSAEALPAAQSLSKALPGRVVAFALADSDEAMAELSVGGKARQWTSIVAGERPQLDAKAWEALGADLTAVTKLIWRKCNEPEDALFGLADALGISRDTVLRDEGEFELRRDAKAPSAKPKKASSPGQATREDAKAAWREAQENAVGAGMDTAKLEQYMFQKWGDDYDEIVGSARRFSETVDRVKARKDKG